MMSGPLPDWIAEVTRAWMSLALIVSKRILIPSAFSPSGTIFSRRTLSEVGTKSDQRTQWMLVAWA